MDLKENEQDIEYSKDRSHWSVLTETPQGLAPSKAPSTSQTDEQVRLAGRRMNCVFPGDDWDWSPRAVQLPLQLLSCVILEGECRTQVR